MYHITTLNWILCQLLYRIGKKRSRRNYATNSEWRKCFEKGKRFTSHSDIMLESIQTTGSPLITNMFHSLNAEKHGLISLLQWLTRNLGHTPPIFRKIAILKCFWCQKSNKSYLMYILWIGKCIHWLALLSKIEHMHPKGCINWNQGQ